MSYPGKKNNMVAGNTENIDIAEYYEYFEANSYNSHRPIKRINLYKLCF